jgi:hypothetical protein
VFESRSRPIVSMCLVAYQEDLAKPASSVKAGKVLPTS